MSLDESQNIFQSVLAKQSCSLASASSASASDHFLLTEALVLPALFVLVSRNQEDIIMVRIVKWRVRESFVHLSVCGVKLVYSFAHLTC